MSESPLRDKLLDLLQRESLSLQLVRAAAGLIAADADFNLAVARHKEKKSDIDFVELVMCQGEVIDRCEFALAELSDRGMVSLSQQLEKECRADREGEIVARRTLSAGEQSTPH